VAASSGAICRGAALVLACLCDLYACVSLESTIAARLGCSRAWGGVWICQAAAAFFSFFFFFFVFFSGSCPLFAACCTCHHMRGSLSTFGCCLLISFGTISRGCACVAVVGCCRRATAFLFVFYFFLFFYFFVVTMNAQILVVLLALTSLDVRRCRRVFILSWMHTMTTRGCVCHLMVVCLFVCRLFYYPWCATFVMSRTVHRLNAPLFGSMSRK